MQFKHPEILWALLLLLIPILIHLLQLRRFKKTPFTNVAMLQRVVTESKKSQNLKKWLLLFTRLLLIAALVIAFTQPFSAKTEALTQKETVLYLDNSFSMQAKRNGMSLLTKSIQDLLQIVPEDEVFSLFTNNETFRDVTIKQVQNRLLNLEMTPEQLSLGQVALKAGALYSDSEQSLKNLIVISDLQDRLQPDESFQNLTNLYLVQTLPDNTKNIYIDSLYLGQADGNQIPLHIDVVGMEEGNTTPISLYDGDKLIAKTAVRGSGSEISKSILTLEQGKSIKGRVVIDDPVLRFDNHFYFNIDKRNNPKVLVISEDEASFLNRIFTEDLFDFQSFTLNELKYNLLESQNTIVLSGLKTIPNSLSIALVQFVKNGGGLVIIPNNEGIELDSYNLFFGQIGSLRFGEELSLEKKITGISFQHPLYRNVFEQEVENFDYPSVKKSYSVSSRPSVALAFGDETPFLLSFENCYVFTGSLQRENSNFINSPLVVPTFYNIAEQSLKGASVYQQIGKEQHVDIDYHLGQDNVIKLGNANMEFIPLQQSFSNKVRLRFTENPNEDGIYGVIAGNDTLQHLSFNYQRNESMLSYLSPNEIPQAKVHSNIDELFTQLQEDNSITDYWKWFVIFALLFALLELLIQKMFP